MTTCALNCICNVFFYSFQLLETFHRAAGRHFDYWMLLNLDKSFECEKEMYTQLKTPRTTPPPPPKQNNTNLKKNKNTKTTPNQANRSPHPTPPCPTQISSRPSLRQLCHKHQNLVHFPESTHQKCSYTYARATHTHTHTQTHTRTHAHTHAHSLAHTHTHAKFGISIFVEVFRKNIILGYGDF